MEGDKVLSGATGGDRSRFDPSHYETIIADNKRELQLQQRSTKRSLMKKD